MIVKYVCEDFLIAYKPHNLPTVPLKNQNEETLLSLVAGEYPQILNVHGKNEWEGSALHRLDTATAGLVIFARNQHFYDYMTKIQQNDLFIKVYKASSRNSFCGQHKTIQTYFRSYGPKGATVKPETDILKSDNKRLYTTQIRVVESNKEITVFECVITRGFRHQIRAHLAFAGCPIIGDNLYNSEKEESDLQLECIKVCFPLENGEKFTFSV